MKLGDKIKNSGLQDIIDTSEHTHSYSVLDGKKRCKVGQTIFQQVNSKEWEVDSINGIKHTSTVGISLDANGSSKMTRRRR